VGVTASVDFMQLQRALAPIQVVVGSDPTSPVETATITERGQLVTLLIGPCIEYPVGLLQLMVDGQLAVAMADFDAEIRSPSSARHIETANGAAIGFRMTVGVAYDVLSFLRVAGAVSYWDLFVQGDSSVPPQNRRDVRLLGIRVGLALGLDRGGENGR
jgi:hypothetical protein